mgnify:CR=1 FL=1
MWSTSMAVAQTIPSSKQSSHNGCCRTYQARSLRHVASYPRSAGVARLASAARHVARRCSSQNRSRTARLQPGNRQRVLIAEGILSRLLGCVLSGYRTRRERTNEKKPRSDSGTAWLRLAGVTGDDRPPMSPGLVVYLYLYTAPGLNDRRFGRRTIIVTHVDIGRQDDSDSSWFLLMNSETRTIKPHYG